MTLSQSQIEILLIAKNLASNEIAKLQNDVNSFGNRVDNAGTKLINFGKNAQWLGKQLTYNVTLPLMGIGAIAVKTAMDVEREWVRVQKVYGDTAEESANFANVQKTILEPAAKDIVKVFGEQRKVAVEVMGEWAAMGKSGQELADITRETFRIMTLGELDQADAINTLRTIMATYGLSVEDASKVMNAFNKIENTTSLRFQDLVKGIPEVVANFKDFNISAREGASVMAGMTQRGLTATESATALKFSLQRLQSPTEKASELMKKYGLSVFNIDGSMRNGVDVLVDFGRALDKMTDEEKSNFITTEVGKHQYNRFSQALAAMKDPTSDFAKAMASSKDDIQNAADAQKELNTILESSPKKWERNIALLKDAGIILGTKLIPHVIKFVEQITKVVDWFNNLNPATQDWILKLSVLLTVLGPIIVAVATMITLAGLAVAAIGKIAMVSKWILGAAKVLLSWTVTFLKIVSKAIWAALQMSAQAIKAAAKWISGAITTLAAWVWAFTKMVAKAVWTGIEFAANAIIAGAKWIIQASIVAAAWTKSFIIMVAKAYWAGLSQQSPALASGLIWVKNAIVASAAWVANFTIMILKAIATAISMSIQAVIAGAKWVAQALLAGTTWVAQFIIMVTKSAWAGIQIAANAIVAAAKWLAQPLLIAAAWIAKFVVIVAESVAAGIKIAANAVVAGAAWILQATKAAAAWIIQFVAMLPFNLGAATGMAANAVIAGSAWVAQAGLAAAAWIAAMAPVALAVAAVAAAIAAVVVSYKAVQEMKDLSNITSKFNKDELETWWKSLTASEKIVSSISYYSRKKQLGYANGGIVKAANGIVAGHSALQDRVPALLTEGEIVLNKEQQKSLLNGGTGGKSVNISVTIQAGTMIASPGEQREFARKIKDLLKQDELRYAL